MRWPGEVSSLKGAAGGWSEPRPPVEPRSVIGSGPFPPAPFWGASREGRGPTGLGGGGAQRELLIGWVPAAAAYRVLGGKEPSSP